MNIGIDEAGRGPLAGPVWVGACVILDSSADFSLFDDSKKMTEKKREKAYTLIQEYISQGILTAGSSYARASTIDRLGIIKAQSQAMRKAVKQIPGSVNVTLLIDGNHTFGMDRTHDVQTIIGGDGLITEISIASVIAKVERDHYMLRQAHKHQQYGFEKHKGYGTQYHRDTIKIHGLSKIHRKSFCKNIQQKNHQ